MGTAGPGSRDESGPPSPRDRQRELTRRALLDAARAAFEERGYTEVTVDDIARRAGTSRGTFYLHFSKAAILQELTARAVASSGPPPVVDIADADLCSAAGIRAWMVPYVNLWRRHQPLMRAFMEADATDPELQAGTRTHFETRIGELTQHIRDHQGDAISRDDARARAAVMALGLSSFLHHVIGRGHDIDVEISLTAIAEQWLHLLHAPPGTRAG